MAQLATPVMDCPQVWVGECVVSLPQGGKLLRVATFVWVRLDRQALECRTDLAVGGGRTDTQYAVGAVAKAARHHSYRRLRAPTRTSDIWAHATLRG
jgi:hypothetical protein